MVKSISNVANRESARYQSELVRQKLINANLKLEITHLENQRRQDMRIRFAIRNLLIAINNAINHYIEKLNRPYRHTLPKLFISKGSVDNADLLIKEMSDYDSRVFKKFKQGNRVLYSLAKFFYRLIKLPFRAVKSVIKMGGLR